MAKDLPIIEIQDKPYIVDGDTLYPLVDYIKENGNLMAKRTKSNTRTILQNASMHKYFSLVSSSLNDAGFSMQKVLTQIKKIELSWTMIAVKDVIWRNFQRALLEKESTTQLETHEVEKVYKNIDYWLSTNIGIEHIDFPSRDSLIFKQNYEGK